MAAWGGNYSGQLGDGTVSQRTVPVAVNTASGVSALSGKVVTAVLAGGEHSLALCSDGTVAAWGDNYLGQLGTNLDLADMSAVPVAVNTSSNASALYARTVTAIAAGGEHSLALCSDGTVVAWGNDYNGQLGDDGWVGDATNAPVAVDMGDVTSAAVLALSAGADHSLAVCADGVVAAWGGNGDGELGDGTGTDSPGPVAVSATSANGSQGFAHVVSGPNGQPHPGRGLPALPRLKSP